MDSLDPRIIKILNDNEKYSFGNFKNLRFKNEFILRLNEFLSNSTDDSMLKELTDLVKTIASYTIDDCAKYIVHQQKYRKYFNKGVFITRENIGSSNVKIISHILSNFSHKFGEKFLITVDPTNYTTKSLNRIYLVYIDDMIGTGNTAIDEFSKYSNNFEKIVICLYASKEGLKNLEEKNIKVEFYKIAPEVNNPSLDELCKNIDDFITVPEEFTLNLALSEEFNSSNNNYPYLYKNRVWKSFLTRRDLRHYKRIKNDFCNKHFHYFTENFFIKHQLKSAGYTSNFERRELFRKFLEYDTNEHSVDVNEIELKFFRSFEYTFRNLGNNFKVKTQFVNSKRK